MQTVLNCTITWGRGTLHVWIATAAIFFLVYLVRTVSESPQTYVRRKTLKLYHCVRRRRPVHRSIAFVDRGRSVNRLPRGRILRRGGSRIVPRGFIRVGHTRSATDPPRRTCTHSETRAPSLSLTLPPFLSRSLSHRSSTPSRFKRWPIFDYLDACHPPYCKLIASNWKTFSGYPDSLSLSLLFSLPIVNLSVSRRCSSSRFHKRYL